MYLLTAKKFLTTERDVMIPTYFRFGCNLTKKTVVRIIVYNALLASIIAGNTLAQETGTSADQPGAGESTCPTPYIKLVKPRIAQVGQTVTIRGRRFGTQEGQISFSGNVAETVTIWANNRITVVVPPSAETGSVIVTRSCNTSSNSGYLKIREPEKKSNVYSGIYGI
jgi:hypothetical protein